MDRQLSWIQIPDEDDPEYDGALTENRLKFFITVYLKDYMLDSEVIKFRNQVQVLGDESFDRLLTFLKKMIWELGKEDEYE